MDVAIDDTGTGFSFTTKATAPIDPEQVCGLLQVTLAGLVAALEMAPATPLRAVDVLGEAARQQILLKWNDTGRTISAATLPPLFAMQPIRPPDPLPVVCGDAAVSSR